ncbi:MAG TPA: hypothetical protein VF784_01940 [Anaerolineales bacterium]
MDKSIKASSPAKIGAVGAIIAILIVTVLEFPPPIGFETRPQTDVSIFWLIFFLIILVTEIAAIPLILKRPSVGWKFGIAAGILNILQVIADQAHLMQPEVAPLGYSVLEGLVAIASIALIYFSLKIQKG